MAYAMAAWLHSSKHQQAEPRDNITSITSDANNKMIKMQIAHVTSGKTDEFSSAWIGLECLELPLPVWSCLLLPQAARPVLIYLA